MALVGVDGSGKSTQAALLASALRARGERARAFENPGGRPVLDGLAHRLGRADGAALVGRQARTGSELVVRSAAIARAVAWACATDGTAVMDRYALCQLATTRARGDAREALAAALTRLAPEPDVLVFLSVDPAVARQRVAARGRDEESLAWLTAFDAAYRTLLPPSAVVVDANHGPEAVARRLLQAATPG